jgi:hypothetical protein
MVRTAKRTRVPRRGRIRVRNEKIEKREKRDQQKEELTAASTGR